MTGSSQGEGGKRLAGERERKKATSTPFPSTSLVYHVYPLEQRPGNLIPFSIYLNPLTQTPLRPRAPLDLPPPPRLPRHPLISSPSETSCAFFPFDSRRRQLLLSARAPRGSRRTKGRGRELVATFQPLLARKHPPSACGIFDSRVGATAALFSAAGSVAPER